MNSTAAVGLVFAPIVGAALSIPAFGVGWCLGYCLTWRQSRSVNRKRLAIVAGLIPALLGIWLFKTVWDGFAFSDQVRRVEQMNAAGLQAVLNQPKWAANKFVLGAIAQNPNAAAADLHRIVTTGRSELYERMGSSFDVMGKNTKGLAVMRLVISIRIQRRKTWSG